MPGEVRKPKCKAANLLFMIPKVYSISTLVWHRLLLNLTSAGVDGASSDEVYRGNPNHQGASLHADLKKYYVKNLQKVQKY